MTAAIRAIFEEQNNIWNITTLTGLPVAVLNGNEIEASQSNRVDELRKIIESSYSVVFNSMLELQLSSTTSPDKDSYSNIFSISSAKSTPERSSRDIEKATIVTSSSFSDSAKESAKKLVNCLFK